MICTGGLLLVSRPSGAVHLLAATGNCGHASDDNHGLRRENQIRMKRLLLTVTLAAMPWSGAAQAATAPTPPGTFIATEGGGPPILAVSTATGAALPLTTTSMAFTNNGLTITPDGHDIFATFVHGRKVWIGEVSTTAGGTPKLMVPGLEPAVSPDGRRLVYISFSGEVALRDLRTGRTQEWDHALGLPCTTWPVNAKVAWTGDSQTLAALPTGPGIAISSDPGNPVMGCSPIPHKHSLQDLVLINPSVPHPRRGW
jgi:hypothetical protein